VIAIAQVGGLHHRYARCVIGNVGLPGWFVATRLRVMLKQPNSRGMPGSFVTIFSAVNRLDVCPVGYYNRRMTFLRGTAHEERRNH